MLILSIETSCDETAVALVEEKKGKFFVRDEYVSSQLKTHAPFGGVVPDLAARDHLKNLPLLLGRAIRKNKIGPKSLDLIAVTEGPGLIPALLIGTNAAKTLAYAWRVPLVGAHHIAGHIYANYVGKSQISNLKSQKSGVKFPVLALIVSGGHTELILMRRHMNFKIVGQTLDDAAGEAFDKAARILNLGYPGGPAIAAKASQISNFKFQILNFSLPRPMINSPNLDFSFSGLKTAVLYTVRDNPKILKSRKLTAALCSEFQQAVVDVLVAKTIRAARKYSPKTIFLGGGVSANKELRKQLGKAVKKSFPNIDYRLPAAGYSLDNAAMIAVAGYYRWRLSKNRKPFYNNWRNLEADAALKL